MRNTKLYSIISKSSLRLSVPTLSKCYNVTNLTLYQLTEKEYKKQKASYEKYWNEEIAPILKEKFDQAKKSVQSSTKKVILIIRLWSSMTCHPQTQDGEEAKKEEGAKTEPNH